MATRGKKSRIVTRTSRSPAHPASAARVTRSRNVIRKRAPSVRTVAAESDRLKAQIERERKARIDQYVTKRARSAAVHARAVQLSVLAEGDSWFDYPGILGTRGSVIDHLARKIDTPILNLAHRGDEVRQMLSLVQREEITRRLTDGVPDVGGAFDILLFSGGGNDLVGDQFCIWLKQYQPGMSAQDVIDTPRLDAVLAIVEAGYRDLLEIRNAMSPTTSVFLHTYDFAVPNGKGVCGVGPWLRPSLKFRQVPQPLRAGVVKEMLVRFDSRVRQLAAGYPKVYVVPTQGTLSASEWDNEIHPDRKGFEKVAGKFAAELRAKFPGI
jgi:hypothetical protein